MNKKDQNNKREEADFLLDITSETCPMTFVRTKLMIEKMATGDVGEVRLKGSEPLENVPRSVRDMGHTVISFEAEEGEDPAVGIHRLQILKN